MEMRQEVVSETRKICGTPEICNAAVICAEERTAQLRDDCCTNEVIIKYGRGC